MSRVKTCGWCEQQYEGGPWGRYCSEYCYRFGEHERQCRRHGVIYHVAGSNSYRCAACGYGWWVMSGGLKRMPRGWWHCPQGCNVPGD